MESPRRPVQQRCVPDISWTSKSERGVSKDARSTWKCRVDRQFLEDLTWWVSTNPRFAGRLLELMEHILRDPEHGIGKPERLKHIGPNIWSRRLTQEHRVIYFVGDGYVDFLMARYHY
jgi:toxin YoeB